MISHSAPIIQMQKVRFAGSDASNKMIQLVEVAEFTK